ncbi:hypothetical protein FKP32DRAFT_1599046 [Trametes sanguinea]|nr:hypothetical protein FKP32DRAFT_1599046 [Trametes sanguinea]
MQSQGPTSKFTFCRTLPGQVILSTGCGQTGAARFPSMYVCKMCIAASSQRVLGSCLYSHARLPLPLVSRPTLKPL